MIRTRTSFERGARARCTRWVANCSGGIRFHRASSQEHQDAIQAFGGLRLLRQGHGALGVGLVGKAVIGFGLELHQVRRVPPGKGHGRGHAGGHALLALVVPHQGAGDGGLQLAHTAEHLDRVLLFLRAGSVETHAAG